MSKRTMNKRRQRKSNKEHFASDAEYKEFARKRNEATRKCRQKMAHERKFYQEAFLRAKEELDLLRQGGGAADLYWRDRAEELQSRLKGEFRHTLQSDTASSRLGWVVLNLGAPLCQIFTCAGKFWQSGRTNQNNPHKSQISALILPPNRIDDCIAIHYFNRKMRLLKHDIRAQRGTTSSPRRSRGSPSWRGSSASTGRPPPTSSGRP